MKRGNLVLLGLLILFATLVLSACVLRLSDVYSPPQSRPAVGGVNHTIGEIVDIRNATVKRAIYADYIKIGGSDSNPKLLLGSSLSELKAYIPLYQPYDDCEEACNGHIANCTGILYQAGNSWIHQITPNLACGLGASDAVKFPICVCEFLELE